MSQNSTRGLIIINTGEGKGKTTAALGQLFRALGAGLNCAVVQFIKKDISSEIALLHQHFPKVSVATTGEGFTWNSEDLSKDTASAQVGWKKALTHLQDKTLDLLVLDELTYPINYNMIKESEVIDALQHRPPHQHVIITGRDVSDTLQDIADTVSNIQSIKHHFDKNILSQKGVEY